MFEGKQSNNTLHWNEEKKHHLKKKKKNTKKNPQKIQPQFTLWIWTESSDLGA